MSGGRRLRCWPVDLGLTVASHGWVHLAPWQWDPEPSAGSPASSGSGAGLGTIEIMQRDPTRLAVGWEGFADAAEPEVLAGCGRWISADWEPRRRDCGAGRRRGGADRAGGGRMLRGSSFYEDFVKTVLTINTSWSSTCRMVSALVAEPGDGAFPIRDRCSTTARSSLRERQARLPRADPDRSDAPHAR